jgi:hypothetical protein
MSAIATTTVPQPPREVQGSALCWVGAVCAGGVETVLGATEALITGAASVPVVVANVLFRTVVYAAVLAIVVHLWQGRNWARMALAVLLGGIGMLTLIIGPIGWLAGGRSELDIDAGFVAFATVRAAHVVAVVGGLVLMFRPAANRYFRTTAASGPGRR